MPGGWRFLKCLMVLCVFIFWKPSVHFIIPLLSGLFRFGLFVPLSPLYVLGINHLSNVQLSKIFSHSVSYLFIWLDIFLAVQKLWNFTRFHFSIVGVIFWTTRVLFRKSWPIPVSYSAFPTFCSNSSRVLSFTLGSLIYLKLIFIEGRK